MISLHCCGRLFYCCFFLQDQVKTDGAQLSLHIILQKQDVKPFELKRSIGTEHSSISRDILLCSVPIKVVQTFLFKIGRPRRILMPNARQTQITLGPR